MLSLFPQFLFPFFAPLILRLAVGILFVVWGVTGAQNKAWKSLDPRIRIGVSILSLCGGLLLIAGLFTQGAALLLMFLSLYLLVFDEKDRAFKLILAAVLLSLFISGAGAFAFDYPL